MSNNSRLREFPVSFFSVVMGLSGLAIAWQKTQRVLGVNLHIDYFLAAVAGITFFVLAAIYTKKWFTYQDAVLAELKHPIKLNFFPAISISLILLSVVALHLNPPLAHGFWLAGTGLHLALMLYVLHVWINHEHFEIRHLNPAWFIPAVGNVLVPIAGSSLGYQEISWFFFSVGMLFWLVLLTIIFNRILFHNPIPDGLAPTLFILIAPPAVGFISYLKLTNSLDGFARVLYYNGLFFTLFLLTQLPRFIKLPFFLSWWAYSFPLAAVTTASWVMYEKTGAMGIKIIALALLLLLTALVCMLIYKTFLAVKTQKICVPG
ncbi:MAG: C4-dicarboxylate ABC transporter [Thiothrix sp.]|nr:MAG: C4-dicarboxylate ABC transporter [Thiothrix sp.]